jgi:preprotein translocase subunit SecG
VLPLYAFLGGVGRPAFVFFHFMTALALIGLVLMHSGRDAGMAGMGYVPQSQGGTHIVERNLTRLTVAVGVVFFINTVILYHLLK